MCWALLTHYLKPAFRGHIHLLEAEQRISEVFDLVSGDIQRDPAGVDQSAAVRGWLRMVVDQGVGPGLMLLTGISQRAPERTLKLMSG